MASIKSKIKGVESLANAVKPWLRWIKKTANTAVKNAQDAYSTAKNYVNAVAKWTSNPAWYAKAKTLSDNYNKRADAFNKWVDAYNARWAQPWQWTPMSHLEFREAPAALTLNWKTQRYPSLERPLQYHSDNAANIKTLSQAWADKFEKEYADAMSRRQAFNDNVPAYIQNQMPLDRVPQMPTRWFPEHRWVLSDFDDIPLESRWDKTKYSADLINSTNRQASNLDFVQKANAMWDRSVNLSNNADAALNKYLKNPNEANRSNVKKVNDIASNAFNDYLDFLRDNGWRISL